MKRKFSVYWAQLLMALPVTMASGVYAVEAQSTNLSMGDQLTIGGSGSVNMGGSANGSGSVNAGGSTIVDESSNTGGLIKPGDSIGGSDTITITPTTTITTLTVVGLSIDLDKTDLGIFNENFPITTLIFDNSKATTTKCIVLNEQLENLTLRNGSTLQGQGITTTEGVSSTLKLQDSTLSQSGNGVVITSGCTLSADGENSLSASNLQMSSGSTLKLAVYDGVNKVDTANPMAGVAILTTSGQLNLDNITLDLQGTEYLSSDGAYIGTYKILTCKEGTELDMTNWTINGAKRDQLVWENGTLYYKGGFDWNKAISSAEDINDLREILGNLIVNDGDIYLEAMVQAMQNAGFDTGHVVINRGNIHITGTGKLDGKIVFNGDLKAIRELFIEKDYVGMKVDLNGGTEKENIAHIQAGKTLEVTSISGEGGMSKEGEGNMIIHGNGHEVGGTLAVQEGQLTFTVEPDDLDDASHIGELTVSSNPDKETAVNIGKNAILEGEKLSINGSQSTVTNEGTLTFSKEVTVTEGYLNNQGSISKVTIKDGTVSGSGSFAGLEMISGVLIVGNSPGMQTYTQEAKFTDGTVIFSLADAKTAATAETAGWGAEAYSTINMSGNALTLGGDVRFVLEIGGRALEILVAAEGAILTFNLKLIQSIAADSLTLGETEFAALLRNTSIIITNDANGLTDDTSFLSGKDITAMLSNAAYAYDGNTLTFSGTVTYNSSLIIPEPATATLSLLALASLAIRRRRR